jgi:hypothetical protein
MASPQNILIKIKVTKEEGGHATQPSKENKS